MRHLAIREIQVSPSSPFLERANWADSFQTEPLRPMINAPQAVARMFGSKPPAWIRLLNGLRNAVVGLVGIKSGQIKTDGDKAGSFPITHQTDETVVFGFDDWHLNFRVVVEVQQQDGGSTVRASTLVRRKHWVGTVYLFLIMPFHKLVVRRLLANLAR